MISVYNHGFTFWYSILLIATTSLGRVCLRMRRGVIIFPAGCRKPEGCCGTEGECGFYCADIRPIYFLPLRSPRTVRVFWFLGGCFVDALFQIAVMFTSCYSKPADSGSKRSSIAKMLLGVFVIYMLHTVWLLCGFLNTKPCDGGRGEHCIASYLTARPRLQVRAGFF